MVFLGLKVIKRKFKVFLKLQMICFKLHLNTYKLKEEEDKTEKVKPRSRSKFKTSYCPFLFYQSYKPFKISNPVLWLWMMPMDPIYNLEHSQWDHPQDNNNNIKLRVPFTCTVKERGKMSSKGTNILRIVIFLND